MNASERNFLLLLRGSVQSVGEPAPPDDLWPRLERRLGEQPRGLGRLDWLMVGLCLALLVSFPRAVMLVLYHL